MEILKQFYQKGMSTKELPCSYGQVTQKNDILITPEEDRVWRQNQRDEGREMGGFKHRNREVITHSELTLQMDELLECALPRLRVRKLYMHKTKVGQGNITQDEVRETARHHSTFLCLICVLQAPIKFQCNGESKLKNTRLNQKGNVTKWTIRDILTAAVKV